MKIGFIGLGNMGAPMARNLLSAGHELIAFDVSQDALSKFSEIGVNIGKSVAELASTENMEVIITMLPAGPHVRSVYLNRSGILASVAKSVLLIDCSTIDPQTARVVATAANRNGNSMLDAPVSGGTGGAEAGTLTFMVGGNKNDVDYAQPILSNMGKNIVYCGDSGNGQVAKVVNNMLLGISMIATAEAMSLGVSLGMNPKVLAGIINTSSGRCWSSELYNPYPGVVENAPASRNYVGGFGVDLMLKDLELATEAAKFVKQPVLLGAVAQQLYQLLSIRGYGKLDFSSIIKLNMRVRPPYSNLKRYP